MTCVGSGGGLHERVEVEEWRGNLLTRVGGEGGACMHACCVSETEW